MVSMDRIAPETPEELAEALAAAARQGKTVTLGGAFSKDRFGGPLVAPDLTISMERLRRVLQYEPRDLTISVEAGMPFADLIALLARDGQTIPLDPPYAREATVGGVIASNGSGPRRRGYGTARDMVIGMKFATLEGKLVQTGGMVVKNVAGLDMGKLLIGSYGTLAAIAVVNFKLYPKPASTRTFLLSFDTVGAALQARNEVLQSVLQPVAVDLLNWQAAARISRNQYVLLLQAGGNRAVLDRYGRELRGAESLEGDAEAALWREVQEFSPRFLTGQPDGAIVRVSCTLSQVGQVMESINGPVVARAGSGVCYGHFADPAGAVRYVEDAARRGWPAVIEAAPQAAKAQMPQWPCTGPDFEMMKRVKEMFDPQHLLNRGRLYGRI
jgi:glycolate oxidase FAD binding subunit